MGARHGCEELMIHNPFRLMIHHRWVCPKWVDTPSYCGQEHIKGRYREDDETINHQHVSFDCCGTSFSGKPIWAASLMLVIGYAIKDGNVSHISCLDLCWGKVVLLKMNSFNVTRVFGCMTICHVTCSWCIYTHFSYCWLYTIHTHIYKHIHKYSHYQSGKIIISVFKFSRFHRYPLVN